MGVVVCLSIFIILFVVLCVWGVLRLMAQVVGAYREQRWWKLLGGVLDTMLR